MTTSTSLVEFLLNLLRDPEAVAAFEEDADGYLASCGVDGLTADDLHDALVLLQDSQDDDGDRNTVHVPAPQPAPKPAPGESEHEAAVKYLNTYITNNHIDEGDTIIDNSFEQNVDTDGGDFNQELDIDNTVAAGEGSVAAGGNIEDSTIATGDNNLIGDENQVVKGDNNTAAFGAGDASSTNVGDDLEVGDGAGFATGGDTAVDNTDNSVEESFNEETDNSVEGSGNTTAEVEVEESFNEEIDNSVNDSDNDNSVNTVEDSFNEV